MTKLTKELYIKHAKHLYAIINDKSTFVRFFSREDVTNLIKTQLSVLRECEKIFKYEKLESKYHSDSLLKSFNNLSKKNIELDKEFKYEDEGDLIDLINYLSTFCTNMFKVNLDDLVEGKNVTATDPKIDLKAKTSMDNDGTRFNSNFAFAGMGGSYNGTPYENPYFLGKAYAKLNQDIKDGKFYKFKTKPRIIPWLKYALISVLLLFALSIIGSAICLFMSLNLKVLVGSDTVSLGNVTGVATGVMYILLVLCTAYPLYYLFVSILGKNESEKYSLNWVTLLVFVLLAIIVVLPDVRSTWLIEVVDTQGQALEAFKVWKILYIISSSLIALMIIPMIIGGIYNPKPDVEKVELKVREYVDLFASESGQAPVPPKADVQKPVDVKETKDKTKSETKK